ncbi:isochorismate synthase [Flavobacteriaceae bacterium MAR_2010_72]|nr:isochorismate synthase [Flavobacteriaceae bacterium MAR_2010_72]TVZ59538.1 isochorismate synthase [Flavobacteriaceae bacterium MAR_2010_105]
MFLEEFFKQINTQYQQGLPFVAYRKPDADEVIALFQNDKSLHKTSNYTESGFVFAPFDDEEDAILIPLEHSKECSVIYEVTEFQANKPKSSIVEQHTDKEFHINLVQNGINAIETSTIQKVVLSRTEAVSLTDSNPLEIFKSLLSNYPTAFVYCFCHPTVGIWLGATPETLLKMEGSRFFTTALAGTQKFDGKIDVVWKDKERHEQQLVTDFIQDNLKTLVNRIQINGPQTVRAGSILHLKTDISATIDVSQVDLKQILKVLHPTPAVCGLPKKEAKQFILKNENYSREYYTGFLGELNIMVKSQRIPNRRNIENSAYSVVKKESNLFVNLRCMQIKNNDAILYVGGGITSDSDPEAEWEETKNKTQTMKSVL